MTDFIITPSAVSGRVRVPPSKSETLRALLFGCLAEGRSLVANPLPSPDIEAMLEALRILGGEISPVEDGFAIEGLSGKIGQAADVIDAGNSGIVLRFVSAIASLSAHPIVITGDHSLRTRRPVGPLLEGLKQLGVYAVSTKGDGHAPVIIQGPLKGGKAVISGEDSQPVSGLLIASVFSAKGLELTVNNPGEKPWVQMTLDWFDRLGVSYHHEDYSRYRLAGGQKVKGFSYTVPGDFSAAVFPLLAAIVTGSTLTVENLDFSDSQGDKEVIALFERMGAKIHIDTVAKEVHVKGGGKLTGIEVDVNNTIDAITPLAVLGCFAEGKTVITNGKIARLKECDRIAATAAELRKMGARIEVKEDGLVVYPCKLKGALSLQAHGDHRMAMSLTCAALAAVGDSRISGCGCVRKSYPGFSKIFQGLGAKLVEAE